MNTLSPIMSDAEVNTVQQRSLFDSLAVIKNKILTVSATNTFNKIDGLISAIYSGIPLFLQRVGIGAYPQVLPNGCKEP